MTDTIDSWATLRMAAMQVAEEDKLEGSDGLLQAADEIAALTGLPSPLRRKMQEKFNFTSESIDRSDKATFDRTSNSLELSDSHVNVPKAQIQVGSTIDSDALQFLKDMDFTPKEPQTVGGTVTFEDVDALMQMGGASPLDPSQHPDLFTDMPKPRHSRSGPQIQQFQANNSKDRERYLQRVQSGRHSQRNSLATTSISRGALSVTSQQSRLSSALQRMPQEQARRLCKTDFQLGLLQSMHVLQTEDRSVKSKSSRKDQSKTDLRQLRKLTDELARPRHCEPSAMDIAMDPSLKFSTYDDYQHCSFKPHALDKNKQQKKTKKKSNNYDSDDERDAKASAATAFYAFLSRQEGDERARREGLVYEQRKRDYDARVDKKQCPQCAAVQSYDEVREKRKQCPQCNMPYVAPLQWHTVARDFLKRARDMQRRKQRNLQQLQEEVLAEQRGSGRAQHQVADVELFLQRLSEAMDRRRERLRKVEAEAYKELTFNPRTSSREEAKKKEDDEDEDDDELISVLSADPVRDFLLRYEEDMIARRLKMPQKYLASHRERERREAEEAEKTRNFRF